MRAKIASWLIPCCLASTAAWAQPELVATPPPNLVVANYNSTSVGPYGGLEGTAYVARIGDPSAAWFNPSGLARNASAQVSGSAGVYQRTLVAPQALPTHRRPRFAIDSNLEEFSGVPGAGIEPARPLRDPGF